MDDVNRFVHIIKDDHRPKTLGYEKPIKIMYNSSINLDKKIVLELILKKKKG